MHATAPGHDQHTHQPQTVLTLLICLVTDSLHPDATHTNVWFRLQVLKASLLLQGAKFRAKGLNFSGSGLC